MDSYAPTVSTLRKNLELAQQQIQEQQQDQQQEVQQEEEA
jgi:hypothetical protein